MKAGSAGSSPDGATKIGACQPLRDFLRRVGEAVANLNTVVVGLDAVERGHQKPAALDISWNPSDRAAAARKARRFIQDATLVHVSEAMREFVRATVKLPRYRNLSERWSRDTSVAERLTELVIAATGEESYQAIGAVLLIHWRNRVVHPQSSAQLTPRQRKVFEEASTEIEANFAGLSVARLLNDFGANRPTLKEISSLVAMSVRTVRAIDSAMICLSEEDLDAFLDFYGLSAKISRIEAETTPGKKEDSVLRLLQSAAPGLVGSYRRLRTNKG